MWNFLDQYWYKFLDEYCKVTFLCYNYEPNWLGWIPIGIIGLIFIVIGFYIVGGFVAGICLLIIAVLAFLVHVPLQIVSIFKKLKTLDFNIKKGKNV